MELVTSRDNPRVKEYGKLVAQKKYRDQTGLFAAEGLRLCLDALNSGLELVDLLVTPQAAQRYPETQRLVGAAARVTWLDQALSGRIADTQNPQGVFAVLRKLDNPQSAVTIRANGCYLLLDQIQDPGNLGTILRTADALEVGGVFLGTGCADPYSPKALRGSMGGVFRLAMACNAPMPHRIADLRAAAVPVYAAALGNETLRLGAVDFSGGGAVLLGNEGNGLDPALVAMCDAGIRIPMGQGANSLNVATAAAILIWEMRRGRAET